MKNAHDASNLRWSSREKLKKPERFYVRREKTSLFLFHRRENGSAKVRKSCCNVIVEENDVKEENKPKREERTPASFVKLVGFYGCISKLNDLIKASSRQKSRDEIDVSILTRELRRLGHQGSKLTMISFYSRWNIISIHPLIFCQFVWKKSIHSLNSIRLPIVFKRFIETSIYQELYCYNCMFYYKYNFKKIKTKKEKKEEKK